MSSSSSQQPPPAPGYPELHPVDPMEVPPPPRPERFDDLEDTRVEDMREMFNLFDFQGTGHIATEDLGTVLRGLGKNLTELEIGDFINVYDKDGSGTLDFASLYSIIATHSPMRASATAEEMMAHFAVFDTYKTGLISCPDLVNLLLERGEPLTRDDVDNLMREITIDGDNMVNIKEFVDYMIRTSYS